MTMMQKVQAKRSKKGFTLVELVIVIAILAILAAIAIPVITTTINSSKISVMQSDCATVNMLVKEAINNQVASIGTTSYDKVAATDMSLNVGNVLDENDVKYATNFFSRQIGSDTYYMLADTASGLKISVFNTASSANKLSIVATTKIHDLASYAGLTK